RVGGEEVLHQRPGHVPAGLLLRRRRYAAGVVQVPDALPLQPVHDLDLRRVEVRDGYGGEGRVGAGCVRAGAAAGGRDRRGDLSRDRLPARTGIDVQQRRHAENPVSSDRGSSTDVPRPLNKPHRAMSRILACRLLTVAVSGADACWMYGNWCCCVRSAPAARSRRLPRPSTTRAPRCPSSCRPWRRRPVWPSWTGAATGSCSPPPGGSWSVTRTTS